MDINELKEKLHSIIENSSKETLEYLYLLLQKDDYTVEFKIVLDKEYDAYQEDKTGNTREEIDAMIDNLLNK